jgi:hypothetical protein
MHLIYHPDAEAELIESARFYEQRVPSLGGQFLDAAELSVGAILEAPKKGSVPRIIAFFPVFPERHSGSTSFPFSDPGSSAATHAANASTTAWFASPRSGLSRRVGGRFLAQHGLIEWRRHQFHHPAIAHHMQRGASAGREFAGALSRAFQSPVGEGFVKTFKIFPPGSETPSDHRLGDVVSALRHPLGHSLDRQFLTGQL